MISRRNIRIKVFQTIYELGQQNEETTSPQAENYFTKKLDNTSALLGTISQLIFLISDYVLIHANQRASKHIVTEADLNISTKIAGNLIIEGLKRNTQFSELLKKEQISGSIDEDLVKKLFIQFAETPEYKKYIATSERNLTEDKALIQFMVTTCIFENENTTSFLSEKYLSWYTDNDMIKGWIDKLIQTPASFNFLKIISHEKLDYAHDLIKCYYDKKDIVFGLIEPKLVNWDAERVALIDLILLHLGICELLYFPTIPVKVTINEYIDLAKSFSTLQSGQFINGLLDNVRKELESEQKIIKQAFIKK